VGVLPQDSGVHVAVTTRLGTEDFAGSSRLEQIHLQGLSVRESVSLLQAFQPSSSGEHRADFRSEDDRAAAEELAELLDGFTLAVEQAGVYLSTHPEVTVRDYLNHLRSQNLTSSDTMLDDDSKTRIEHREKLLSVILDQSLTDLEHTLPGSLQVLRLAAAMPPDAIPWPWLEELTKRTNPEVCEPTPQFLKGRWTRIRRTLEGRDLITEGRHPGATGRMHRLVADHLKTHNPQETDLVNDFIIHRARKLGADFTQAPELWEIDSITDALPDILTRKPELLEQVPDFIRHVALRYVTDTRITAMLKNLTAHLSGTSTQTSFLVHSLLGDALQNTDPAQARESYQRSLAITRHLVEIWPEDLQARRDLTIALINVAGMLKNSDPRRAVELYEESLDIIRDLAGRLSGDVRVRRDLTVALNNVAGMLKHSDPRRAMGLYEESLGISRELAAELLGDLQVRRDLTVALDNVAGMVRTSDPGRALELYEESLDISRDLAGRLSGDLQARRDLTIALENVAGMVKTSDPGRAVELYEESLDIRRDLASRLPGNLQALWDLGVAAARLAQLLPTENPERIPLWREAAISLRDALAIQPENRELARMSYYAARRYADCDTDDRDEWLAYAAGLAERFGFGKE